MRIGSRGSSLALTQTNVVAKALRDANPGLQTEILIIRTKGDIMQDTALARIGGKGLFVKEIEEALLAGTVDIAVHSLKDMPAELPEGLEIGATPERGDPRDAWIAADGRRIEDAPPGARIGTGSLRRGLQVRRMVPQAEIVPIRGNLDTRIRKIASERLAGVVVAAAGLSRMGWTDRATQILAPDVMLPAVGQGILAVEMRSGDRGVREILQPINDAATGLAAKAERAFLRALGGGCQLPVAAYAESREGRLRITGLVGSADGSAAIRDAMEGPDESAAAMGTEVAERILRAGGRELLAAVYGK
ncbi:MAG TPA: hydroxymethylbilane synthase [Syntrophales bacterium]|nr:hydroxymethylbilane synthase [Syntrophales bacterium]